MRARSSGPRSLLPLGIVLGLLGLFVLALGLGPGARTVISELPPLRRVRRARSHLETDTDHDPRPSTCGPKVIEVGRADDGSIATPGRRSRAAAGWYTLSAEPG